MSLRRLALAAVCLLAVPAAAEEQVRSVSVTGTSVARVTPDTVVWNVTFTDTDPQLAVARKANDQRIQKLLALREPMDIEAKDLQTGYLNIDKVYERDRSGNQREFRHYRVTRSAKIRQPDVKRFDEMLQALSELENISISFGLESSKFHEIRFDTRLDALKAAQRKAKAMTELLGGKLGEVLRIDETARPTPWSNPVSNSFIPMGPQATPDDIRGSFAPGAIEVRVSVDVRFAID